MLLDMGRKYDIKKVFLGYWYVIEFKNYRKSKYVIIYDDVLYIIGF